MRVQRLGMERRRKDISFAQPLLDRIPLLPNYFLPNYLTTQLLSLPCIPLDWTQNPVLT